MPLKNARDPLLSGDKLDLVGKVVRRRGRGVLDWYQAIKRQEVKYEGCGSDSLDEEVHGVQDYEMGDGRESRPSCA